MFKMRLDVSANHLISKLPVPLLQLSFIPNLTTATLCILIFLPVTLNGFNLSRMQQLEPLSTVQGITTSHPFSNLFTGSRFPNVFNTRSCPSLILYYNLNNLHIFIGFSHLNPLAALVRLMLLL